MAASDVVEPPRKKRKLSTETESKTEDPDTSLLDLILSQNAQEIFGSDRVPDDKLQQFAAKLIILQQETLRRLSNSNSLSLEKRLVQGVVCTRAYVGDGDRNEDSEGIFMVGPNRAEIRFDFSGMQQNGCSIEMGSVSLGDIWSVEDIDDASDMHLYYSRKKTQELIAKSGFEIIGDDAAVDEFAKTLTKVCFQKFRETAKASVRSVTGRSKMFGSININFDFETLWQSKELSE